MKTTTYTLRVPEKRMKTIDEIITEELPTIGTCNGTDWHDVTLCSHSEHKIEKFGGIKLEDVVRALTSQRQELFDYLKSELVKDFQHADQLTCELALTVSAWLTKTQHELEQHDDLIKELEK